MQHDIPTSERTDCQAGFGDMGFGKTGRLVHPGYWVSWSMKRSVTWQDQSGASLWTASARPGRSTPSAWMSLRAGRRPGCRGRHGGASCCRLLAPGLK